MTERTTEDTGVRSAKLDADVHIAVPSVDALLPYLSSYWCEEIANTAFSGAADEVYPSNWPITNVQRDAGRGRRQLDLDGANLCEHVGAEYAVLNCTYAVDSIHNPDAAVAVARAVNEWQRDEWLDRDPRLRASALVPVHDPDASAKEVSRLADRRFVQVALPARSRELYGQRRYRPLLRAAVEAGMAISIQFGGFSGNPPTGVGWPTYHVEEYVGMAQIVQSQLLSMIAEGVFQDLPELKVVVVDGGFTWLPAFMWRFDKDWKGIRREVPWLSKAPSEYIHEHLHFTLAPVDAPTGEPDLLAAVLRQSWAQDLLIYGSHYPHWHDRRAAEEVLETLDADAQRRVLVANAAQLYDLNGLALAGPSNAKGKAP